MDAGSDHGSAVKGSAIDLEVAGTGLVSCCFFFPSSWDVSLIDDVNSMKAPPFHTSEQVHQ